MTQTEEAIKFARSKWGKAWLAQLSVSATRRQEYTFSDTTLCDGRRRSDTERFLTAALSTVTDHLGRRVAKAAHNMCLRPSERNAMALLQVATANAHYTQVSL